MCEIENFTLPQQEEHASCWAAVGSAIQGFLQNKKISQKDFMGRNVSSIHKTGGANLGRILEEYNLVNFTLTRDSMAAFQGKTFCCDNEHFSDDEVFVKIRNSLLNRLPVIASIAVTEDSNVFFKPTAAEPVLKRFTMHHAVVITKCNSDFVYFLDPSPNIPAGLADRGISPCGNHVTRDCFGKFLYMTADQFGPMTRKKLQIGSDQGDKHPESLNGNAAAATPIFMRIEKLLFLKKPEKS